MKYFQENICHKRHSLCLLTRHKQVFIVQYWISMIKVYMFNRNVNLSMKNIFPLNSGANTSLPCKCIGSSDLLYVVWNGKKVRTLSFLSFSLPMLTLGRCKTPKFRTFSVCDYILISCAFSTKQVKSLVVENKISNKQISL